MAELTLLSTVITAIVVLLISYFFNIVVPLAINVRTSRRSGLTILLRPCLKLYGTGSPISWKVLVLGNWPWKYRHAPFAMLNTDSFLTVAPGGIVFHTADADVIAQITSRQADFPKASHLYKSVNIYGENVVAAEGATWRSHRKLTSPIFGESNNQLVWEQSLRNGKAMLSTWQEVGHRPISTLGPDTMLLSLSVIGRAGLGQTIHWPTSTMAQDTISSQEVDLPNGHQMTFTAALTTILVNMYYIVLLPQWFLRLAPIKVVKQSYMAYVEWGRYLQEIISAKRESESTAPFDIKGKNDLLSQLLKEHDRATLSAKVERQRLSDSEILGNLFVMVIASHETSANSIHFCLILLAMHPRVQREVQQELDTIFRGRSPETWSYEQDLPKLINSKLNAVLNEQLRLIAPTPTIPKYTNSPQKLSVNGKEVTVPARTIVRLCLPSLHRNPAHWPSYAKDKSPEEELESFRPSRWFNSDGSWYQPPKGAYIPFSDGARACLGRRFAQVEILAVLALVLVSLSVELAVDHVAVESTDESGAKNRRRDVVEETASWHQAREEARRTMKEKDGLDHHAAIYQRKFRARHNRAARKGEIW